MRSVYISPSQSAQIQKYLVKIKVLDAKGNVRYDVRVVSLRGHAVGADGGGGMVGREDRWQRKRLLAMATRVLAT